MTHANDPVRKLFADARQLPAAEQAAWLDRHCGDDSLRREVQTLLRFDVDDPFLEQPLVAPVDHDATYSYPTAAPLTSRVFAGRYKLLQPIGEGGFGVVYMAEQTEPVRRRVAIKVLRSGMNSKSVLARFESERQALAMMDHPNIAKVFDGGVADDGTPYFVMELVNGVPITEFCDANESTNSQRMSLLINICHAVQHAHQKGIIHRDLKPSNILVSLLDGTPVPKVIDFGIAKALHGPLTDRTLFTSFQQMIGTPEYMSPEQAETSILDVDTRSDVFSLGVIAYELLTGTTPFDGRSLRKLAFAEIQRTIREVDPPKPSDRVSTLGEQAVPIAGKHGLNRSGLHKAVRGDLDWIVMKAMEKDRNRRYGSAQSLADDLKRWIDQEPIQARPPSVLYRSAKWLRKYRVAAAFAVLILLGGILSAIGLGYVLAERDASLQRQRIAAERTQQIQKLADLEADLNKSLRYGNAMVAANESFRSGRRGITLELLAQSPPDKRGVEWGWLNHLAADRTEVLMPGLSDHRQISIAFAGQRGRLYSGGEDGMLRLWDTESKQELRSWRIDVDPLVAIDVGGDQGRLALCSRSGRVTLWDPTTGKEIASSQQPIMPSVVAMHDDADPVRGRLAVGTDDGQILVWNLDLRGDPVRLVNTEQRFTGPIQTLRFNSDGSQLLAAGKGGCTLFATQSGRSLAADGVAWQSYGALYVDSLNRIAIYGPPVVTVDATTLQDRKAFEIPATSINRGVYVPTDQSLVLATPDQALRRIHLQTGFQQTLAYIHSHSIVNLSAAADGSMLAMTDDSGAIKILKRDAFSAPQSWQAFDGEVARIAADRSDQIYCLSDQGELVCWNANRDIEISRTSAHKLQGFSLILNRDGSQLLSNGLDRRLVTRSTRTVDDPSRTFDLQLGARYLTMHPDGDHFAGPMPSELDQVADIDGNHDAAVPSNLAYWNLQTGRVERCFAGLTNWAMKLRFSADGTMLAAATISDGAVIWRLDSPDPIKLVSDGMPQVDDVVFSADSRFLMAAYHNGQVIVWDLKTRQVHRKLVCHSDQISGLLLTADGSRLVTATISDQGLRVWDWRSGQKVAEFDSGVIGVSELQFVDQQQSLLIGCKSGRVCRLKIAGQEGSIPARDVPSPHNTIDDR